MKYGWLNQSCGLCQVQSRKNLATAGNFLEYHGSQFVFLFPKMSSHVKSLKSPHP